MFSRRSAPFRIDSTSRDVPLNGRRSSEKLSPGDYASRKRVFGNSRITIKSITGPFPSYSFESLILYRLLRGLGSFFIVLVHVNEILGLF